MSERQRQKQRQRDLTRYVLCKKCMFKERKTEGERNKMLTENECVRVFI